MKKIALVASGPTYKKAPFSNPEWEIWANAPWVMRDILPVEPDYWFELHAYEDLKSQKNGIMQKRAFGVKTTAEKYYKKMITRIPAPVYMQRKYEFAQNSIAYPLEKVIKKFGAIFTSSASYILGLAILQNPDVIGIWGIHMDSTGEYKRQRECFEYLLNLASFKGIKIKIPKSCSLKVSNKFKKPETPVVLYAIDWTSPEAWWRK